jgi:DNA-directed RNA polymerase subunit L
MSVLVENVVESEGTLTFNIRGVETCVVNSLRRTCLSNIKTLVFKGFPHHESSINIIKNTTSFNNEYLKHRISCIPIMSNKSNEFDQLKENHKIVVDVKNEKGKQEKKYVTTKDIVLVNKQTNNEVQSEMSGSLFPPDPISGEHILLCVLYPNHNLSDNEMEELNFEAEFEIGCAQENSCWNVVHNCTYEFLRNEPEISKRANNIEDKMEKRDFEILDAQRIYYENEYKMTVESLGIFTNRELIAKSCEYIISKLNLIIQYTKDNELANVQTKEEYISASNDGTKSAEEIEEYQNMYCNIYTEDDFFVFELKEDDYTIGKLIEVYLYSSYKETLSFVGFKKNHPVQPNAHIYIRYKKEQSNKKDIFSHIKNTALYLQQVIFKDIHSSFIGN